MKTVARCFLISEVVLMFGGLCWFAPVIAAGLVLVCVTGVALFFAAAERVP